MRHIKGDLIQLAVQGNFDVIVHGCNCFCAMEAGIALAIKQHFPEAYEADLKTQAGDRSKLGAITCGQVDRDGIQLTVVNGYTQYNFGGGGRLVDYDAVRSVFQQVKDNFSGQRIGYPAIGAGLAGGDWNIIYPIIKEELKGEDHTYVEYQKS